MSVIIGYVSILGSINLGSFEHAAHLGSAILASFLLDEKLGRLGVCGCASCIVSSQYPSA